MKTFDLTPNVLDHTEKMIVGAEAVKGLMIIGAMDLAKQTIDYLADLDTSYRASHTFTIEDPTTLSNKGEEKT